MLVLSRRTDECVWIGRSIQVKVLEIQNGRVKLGFSAPADVPVQREEIRRRAEGQDNLQAQGGENSDKSVRR